MLFYATELKTLKEDGKMKVDVNQNKILLVFVEEHVYAISNKCPHLGVSLEKGTVEGATITCKAHHATFDLKTGDIIEKPRFLMIKMPSKKVKTYPVEIKNDKVFVELSN